MKASFSLMVLAFSSALLLVGCAEDSESTPAASTDAGSDGDGDGRLLDTGPDQSDGPTPGSPRWARPPDTASIVFRVDDSANRTYRDGEMEWNGSMSYDPATNFIEFASSWLPDQGPYPPLYDDGTYTQGGHEAEGEVAGDGRFSLEVFFNATETTTFEYGLIDELDHWIWVGPNGQVTVLAGETGTVEAAGYSIPGFGTIDMRVTVDTAHLHEDFNTFDPASDALFLKGSMISWKPVQLLDNGERGDAAAGDGVFTFTLSEYLGPHDGLLQLGQEAQFVVVFFEAEGLEYKLAGDALVNGITAFSAWDNGQPGVFLEEELLLRTESRGSALNTAILVGPDQPDQVSQPTVLFIDPDRGPTSGGTPVEVRGDELAPGAVVTFDEAEADCQVQSEAVITCTSPPRSRPGTVPVTVENPDGGSDTHSLGFTYVDAAAAPRVTSVDPSSGSEVGGTIVTIGGANFGEGAAVLFGNDLSDGVTFDRLDQMTAVTPPHSPGPVDVTVRNPDGQTGTLRNGFDYAREGIDYAIIQHPTATIVAGVSEPLPALFGRVYEQGVTEPEGQGAGITAELLYAPSGSTDPTDNDSDWTPAAMTYNGDLGNDDEYKLEALSIDSAGEYLWVVRFSLDGGLSWTYGDLDGSLNGFSLARAGTMSINAGLRIDAIDPRAVSPLDEPHTFDVVGANFRDDMTVEIRPAGGSSFSAVDGFDFVDSAAFSFESSGIGFAEGVYGRSVDLRLTTDDDALVLGNAFLVGLVRSPTVDGTIEVSEADWHGDFRLALSDRDSDWGSNALYALYAAFDERGLYLAIEADLERQGVPADPGNAIVVYLDTDYGSGSGFRRMLDIGDEDADLPASYWRLDRAITSELEVIGLEGFGADFAFGSMELEPLDRDDYLDALTGWRRLVAGDMWWYDIESSDGSACTYSETCPADTAVTCVAGTATGEEEPGRIETFVPWCVLYGDEGVPEGGRRLALFARILNREGQFVSNQSLPEEPELTEETRWDVTELVVFDVLQ